MANAKTSTFRVIIEVKDNFEAELLMIAGVDGSLMFTSGGFCGSNVNNPQSVPMLCHPYDVSTSLTCGSSC